MAPNGKNNNRQICAASRDDKRVIVALLSSTGRTDEGATSTGRTSLVHGNSKSRKTVLLHQRKDPCTDKMRLYALLDAPTSSGPEKCRQLCEIQTMLPPDEDEESMYAAFLVKTAATAHVAADGKLYTITHVDPLFFVVPLSNSSEKWEPLDQILGLMDPVLRSCINQRQLSHLFAKMKLSPQETFYKFSPVLALEWLRRKQHILEEVLVQQEKESYYKNKKRCNNGGYSSNAASFSNGFFLPEKEKDESQEPEKTPSEEVPDSVVAKWKETTKEASVQIICNYLNEEWRRRFLEHMELTTDVLQTPKQRAAKRARSTSDMAGSAFAAEDTKNSPGVQDWVHEQATQPPPEKKAKKETPKSAAAKQLAKVNTKGMKKMTHFFSVAKSKKENKKKN